VSKSGAALVTAATMIAAVVAGCPHGAASPGPSATASARFVGHWHVHDASLNIAPTTATLIVSLGIGPCTENAQAPCSETDQLAVISGDDTQLTLSVTAVSYTLHDSKTTSVNPSTGPSTAVGDSLQLRWQAPGLLMRTALTGFPGWQGGNPYWCGAGISQGDAEKCGA
jgi:hypothetical protein